MRPIRGEQRCGGRLLPFTTQEGEELHTADKREARVKVFALAPVIRDTIKLLGDMVQSLCHVTKITVPPDG